MVDRVQDGANILFDALDDFLKQEDLGKILVSDAQKVVLAEGLNSAVEIQKMNDCLIVTSVGSNSSNQPDFSLTFRIGKKLNKNSLWPINFSNKNGLALEAEKVFQGNRFTNVIVQNELIKIANIWGKGLASQVLANRLRE